MHRKGNYIHFNRLSRDVGGLFFGFFTKHDFQRVPGQYAIINRVRRRKWKIGHTLKTNTTLTSFQWNLHGSRRIGITSNMWRRKVAAEVAHVSYTQNEIKTLAMNRSDWNEFDEDLNFSNEQWEKSQNKNLISFLFKFTYFLFSKFLVYSLVYN